MIRAKKESNPATSSRGLILFVRRPELGKVKTRLAATEGALRALEIYNLLLDHTRIVIRELEGEIFTFYSDEIDADDLWQEVSDDKYLQASGDLGDKMQTAFELVTKRCDRVLIIGSDCAQIRSHHIEQAWSALEDHDLVMGPSLDGGYYLLGMKQVHPSLFEDMPWSTEEVANQTRQRAAEAGLKTHELEPLSDIDYIDDWNQYGAPFIFKETES